MNSTPISLLLVLGLLTIATPVATLAAPASGFYNFDGTTYSQNFDNLPASLTAETTPAYVATDVTGTGLAGWQVSNAGTATNLVWRGLNGGTVTSSGYHGLGSDGDYALGGLANASSAKPTFGITLKNTSGATINSLSLSYVIEQWRVGNSNVANVLALEYKTSATYASIAGSGADTSFLSGATTSSPQSSSTASALDGNAAANQVAVSVTLSSLAWEADSYFVLRWERQDGALDALGIDNLVISTIPEPSTSAAILGAVLLAGVVCRRRRR